MFGYFSHRTLSLEPFLTLPSVLFCVEVALQQHARTLESYVREFQKVKIYLGIACSSKSPIVPQWVVLYVSKERFKSVHNS